MTPRFRPRLLDEESALFRALVLVLVPLCVGGGVATRAYAEPPSLALDAATELARGLRAPPPPRVTIRMVPAPVGPSTAPGPRPERRRGPSAPRSQPGGALAGVLATMGDAERSLFSPGLEDRLAAAVAGVAPEHASRDDGGLRGQSAGRDDIGAGIVESGHGAVEVGTGRVAEPVAERRWTVAPEQAPAGAEAVGEVVRGARGRVESCVQVASRLDPGLHGRVELGWVVAGGRPAEVVVKENRTGNRELGDCLRRAVLSLDFGEGVDTAVDGYAWVVQSVE